MTTPPRPATEHLADAEFVELVGSTLGALPGAVGVALGGSRARGAHRPDSDWDFAVYYRDGFDVDNVRALGWPGSLTDIGGWGELFNGGGNVTVGGRSVDIHYRDLTLIERIQAEAAAGRFWVDGLLFHQAGIPSYILLAELGLNRTVAGELPRWGYPPALWAHAPAEWWASAELTLNYALHGHAERGRVAQCASLLSEAACRAGHAVLAARGEWVTNEKGLLAQAGLDGVDQVVATMSTDATTLVEATEQAWRLLAAAASAAGIPVDAETVPAGGSAR